jgi:hypothetical protein
MAWVVLAVVVLASAVVFARRRRRIVMLPASETISTMHMELSKRRTAKTRAALEAATLELR